MKRIVGIFLMSFTCICFGIFANPLPPAEGTATIASYGYQYPTTISYEYCGRNTAKCIAGGTAILDQKHSFKTTLPGEYKDDSIYETYVLYITSAQYDDLNKKFDHSCVGGPHTVTQLTPDMIHKYITCDHSVVLKH
jgi:hypothetical protein